MSSDDPNTFLAHKFKDLSDEERKAVVIKAFNHLKDKLEKFAKPDGSRQAPAKTCKDLAEAYPSLSSGNFSRLYI